MASVVFYAVPALGEAARAAVRAFSREVVLAHAQGVEVGDYIDRVLFGNIEQRYAGIGVVGPRLFKFQQSPIRTQFDPGIIE